MRLWFLFAAALMLAPPALAQQQPPPAQVEAWAVDKTGRIGQAIWRQDVAAARATDALLAQSDGRPPEGVIGWIVVDEGEGQLVRFLSGTPEAPHAFKDVTVDARFQAGPVMDAADPVLPQDQIARFAARNAAAQNTGALRCAARYNAVVLDDPDGDGWLVWLLASTTQANMVPMGGHYRYHVSADGRTVERREQLSGGCLDLDKNQATRGGQTVGLVTNVIVAPRPLEVHVFLSLLNRVPIYVMADQKLWAVEGARIRQVDMPAR